MKGWKLMIRYGSYLTGKGSENLNQETTCSRPGAGQDMAQEQTLALLAAGQCCFCPSALLVRPHRLIASRETHQKQKSFLSLTFAVTKNMVLGRSVAVD